MSAHGDCAISLLSISPVRLRHWQRVAATAGEITLGVNPLRSRTPLTKSHAGRALAAEVGSHAPLLDIIARCAPADGGAQARVTLHVLRVRPAPTEEVAQTLLAELRSATK